MSVRICTICTNYIHIASNDVALNKHSFMVDIVNFARPIIYTVTIVSVNGSDVIVSAMRRVMCVIYTTV